MTVDEAKKYGGKEIFRTTIILFLILEIIFLLRETNGDFANGILFFIEGQANIFFLLFLLLCFSTNYLLGLNAGKKIIIQKENYITISLFYSFLLTITILLFHSLIVFIFMKIEKVLNPFFSYSYFFDILLKEFSLLIVPNILSWIWATRRMQRKSV